MVDGLLNKIFLKINNIMVRWGILGLGRVANSFVNTIKATSDQIQQKNFHCEFLNNDME